MEDYRLAFMRMEELWFEPDIGPMCGGWIEVLVRAVEESPDLNLKRDFDGVRKGRSMWNVELIGGISSSGDSGSESVDDDIPEDWIPGETPYSFTFPGEVSDSDVDLSTGNDGDVSDGEGDDEWESGRTSHDTFTVPNEKDTHTTSWGVGNGVWGGGGGNWDVRIPLSANSTGGWDGDESEETS